MGRAFFLVLSMLWLVACADGSGQDEADPGPEETATPTPAGTWETVIQGRVYDGDADTRRPILGATITYDVLRSLYAGLQEGRANTATTDDQGAFALPVLVHDTDAIRILIEAPGYEPYEEKLTGVELVAGRSVEVELTRAAGR